MEETKQTGFMKKVIKIFTSPTQVFTEIKENPKVLKPILFLIVASIVVVLLSGTVNQIAQTKMMNLMVEKYDMNIPQNTQTNNQTTMIIGAVFTPVMLLIVLSFSALLYWALSKMLKGKATYKQVFCVCAYSSIIMYVFSIVSVIICTILNTDVNPFSLAVFIPNGSYDSFLYDLLMSINLIGVWSTIVSAIGLSIVNEFNKAKGYWITFSIYILGALISAGSAMIPFMLQGMMHK